MKAVLIALTVLLVAALGLVFYITSGTRWQDAYSVMGVAEGGADALSVAQAMADDQPPQGLALEQRLHQSGMLARVLYEKLDALGAPVERYEVRALVPALPFINGVSPDSGIPAMNCPPPCREQVQKSGATFVESSGAAGLADEWLLRMPVGKPYSLGRRSLRIQDIAEQRVHAIPQAAMQVTLLEVCQARPRIGSAISLRYTAGAVRLPVGFVTRRWVQLDGCQQMMAAAPAVVLASPSPVSAASEPRFRSSWPSNRPAYEAVKPEFDGDTEPLKLTVDEDWLTRHAQPLTFHMLRACRFDRGDAKWLPLPSPEGDSAIEPQPPPATLSRAAYRFPRDNALYFAEWAELWADGSEHRHSALLPSGSRLCRDNDLPQPADDQVVACVPQGQTSETMLVPRPERLCPQATAPPGRVEGVR